MDVRLGYGTFGKARARLGAFYRVSVRALFDGNGCAAELNGYSGLNAAAKCRQYGAYHIKRLRLILNNLAIARSNRPNDAIGEKHTEKRSQQRGSNHHPKNGW